MNETQALIAEIDAYLATAGIKESTFGMKVLKDGRLLPRLRAGGSVTLRSAEKIRAFMAAESRLRRARQVVMEAAGRA